MAATPEKEHPTLQIKETQEEFIVPETLQKTTGISPVQKHFTAQVSDDKGQPIIQTPSPSVISVAPPFGSVVLKQKSKGKIGEAITWLAVFWLRVLKKAAYFGWNVVNKN